MALQSNSPEDRIPMNAEQSTLKYYWFPLTTNPFRFSITETQWQIPTKLSEIGKGRLKPIKNYILPLPTPIEDRYTVKYEINPLPMLQKLYSGATVDALSRAAGHIPNQFKTVILDQPEFKTHQFEWKLGPRNLNESNALQRLLFSLRRGMTPPSTKKAKALLEFPNIFLLSFSPSPVHLYKLKPCVLASIDIDYMGGNRVPVFYNVQNPNQIDPGQEAMIPESVHVKMNFLEMEYWLREDMPEDANGLPTPGPFDNLNFYVVE